MAVSVLCGRRLKKRGLSNLLLCGCGTGVLRTGQLGRIICARSSVHVCSHVSERQKHEKEHYDSLCTREFERQRVRVYNSSFAGLQDKRAEGTVCEQREASCRCVTWCPLHDSSFRLIRIQMVIHERYDWCHQNRCCNQRCTYPRNCRSYGRT